METLKISSHIGETATCIDLIAHPIRIKNNKYRSVNPFFHISNSERIRIEGSYRFLSSLVQVMRPSYPDVRAGSSDLNFCVFLMYHSDFLSSSSLIYGSGVRRDNITVFLVLVDLIRFYWFVATTPSSDIANNYLFAIILFD